MGFSFSFCKSAVLSMLGAFVCCFILLLRLVLLLSESCLWHCRCCLDIIISRENVFVLLSTSKVLPNTTKLSSKWINAVAVCKCKCVMRSFAHRPEVRYFLGCGDDDNWMYREKEDLANEMSVNVLTLNEGHKLYALFDVRSILVDDDNDDNNYLLEVRQLLCECFLCRLKFVRKHKQTKEIMMMTTMEEMTKIKRKKKVPKLHSALIVQ